MKTPGVASKAWQMIRMTFMLIRKGISMKKILLDLSLMMKRRKNKIAGKALRNLIHHHNSAMHAGAAREYEFSCSNTPLYRHYFTTTTKKRRNSISMPSGGEIESTIEAVDRVLERIARLQNNKDDIDEDFHVDGVEEMMLGSSHDQRVDEAAEEFIKRFYSQLKQQPSTPFLNQEMLENPKM